jgi:APA family basic amino acid/polyamine antiporter
VTNTSVDSRLLRAVGTWGLAAGIVNITIGGGIFRLPADVAGRLGPAAPLAYLVCAVAMALIVLCFAEAGSRVPLSGGLYAYVEVAFGPRAGFVMGVLLWAGLSAAAGLVASFFADAVGALVPASAGTVPRAALIVTTFAVLAVINLRGIRTANGVNAGITVAKLLPLALFIIVGLIALEPSSLEWTATPPPSEVADASAVLIFAFLGVEAALVPSGEVRDPARTIPRAVFIAIGGVTVVYLATQVAAQSALGSALATSATPVADAAGAVLGGWGRTLILVGSAVSMLGYIGGVTLAIPRLLFAFARDGFLPRALAAVHDRARTPHVAIIVQTALHATLAVTGAWKTLIYIANGATLAIYLVCCFATIELRRRNVTGTGRPFVIPGGEVVRRGVPWAAALAVAVILVRTPRRELAMVAAVALVALFIALVRPSSRREPHTPG